MPLSNNLKSIKDRKFVSLKYVPLISVCFSEQDMFEPWQNRHFKNECKNECFDDLLLNEVPIFGGYPFYKPKGWTFYAFKNCEFPC